MRAMPMTAAEEPISSVRACPAHQPTSLSSDKARPAAAAPHLRPSPPSSACPSPLRGPSPPATAMSGTEASRERSAGGMPLPRNANILMHLSPSPPAAGATPPSAPSAKASEVPKINLFEEDPHPHETNEIWVRPPGLWALPRICAHARHVLSDYGPGPSTGTLRHPSTGRHCAVPIRGVSTRRRQAG
jgi:hypothetical protein